jgi:hypothetical protein
MRVKTDEYSPPPKFGHAIPKFLRLRLYIITRSVLGITSVMSNTPTIHKGLYHCNQYSMEKDLANAADITHVKSLSKIYMLHLSY